MRRRSNRRGAGASSSTATTAPARNGPPRTSGSRGSAEEHYRLRRKGLALLGLFVLWFFFVFWHS